MIGRRLRQSGSGLRAIARCREATLPLFPRNETHSLSLMPPPRVKSGTANNRPDKAARPTSLHSHLDLIKAAAAALAIVTSLPSACGDAAVFGLLNFTRCLSQSSSSYRSRSDRCTRPSFSSGVGGRGLRMDAPFGQMEYLRR